MGFDHIPDTTNDGMYLLGTIQNLREVYPRGSLSLYLFIYLFIMCTEALVSNIKKAEREKQLTCIKVARGSPQISHLLFADDSLFLCKAQREECQTILWILKKYEVVSVSRSSIQFGHKIEEPIRQELHTF